eukprot:Selendium_serpulae@DN5389_c0_g1_i2.p1
MGTTRDHAEPLSLVAKDLTVRVPQSRLSRSEKPKTLLHNVDLCFQPGQLVAIMGPSGAGKSTLLSVLASRVTPKTKGYLFGGDVFVNGRIDYKKLRHSANVVPQNPNMKSNLATEEIMRLSCDLRTSHKTAEEKEERIEHVLSELGLLTKRNLRPGDENKKTMSGGEQRLLSIANELVDDPSILLLDEPTTGLDAARAYDVIEMLSGLAKSANIVVVCTIHQPRSQAFWLFDTILLLSNGKTVFHGSPRQSIDFFESVGCSCPNNFNPADFMLDLITPVPTADLYSQPPSCIKMTESESIEEDATNPSTMVDDFMVLSDFNVLDTEPEDYSDMPGVETEPGRCIALSCSQLRNLPLMFKNSPYGKRLTSEIQSQTQEPLEPKDKSTLLSQSKSTWCGGQNFKVLSVLIRRDLLNDVRDSARTTWQIGVNLMVGVIFGGIFFNLSCGGATAEQTVADGRNISGALFALTSQMATSCFDIIYSFPEERVLMNRETWRGYYSPTVYFIAKTFTDLPFTILPAMIRVILFYLLTQIGDGSASQLFQFILICSLCIWASCSISFLVSSAVHRADIGMYIGPLVTLFLMLASGYFITDNALPSFVGWVKYISILRYSYYGLIHVIFKDGRSWGEGEGQMYSEELRALMYFDHLSFPICVCMLVSFIVFLRIITLVFLRFTHRRIGLNI